MSAPTLPELIRAAAADERLLPAAEENIEALLAGASDDFYAKVITELAETGEWNELTDRFYKRLAFGTGGLRGRTIGKVLAAAERGTPDALGRPEFPCVGTNAMNFYNISRATQGLVANFREWFSAEGIYGKPKIVFLACNLKRATSANLTVRV